MNLVLFIIQAGILNLEIEITKEKEAEVKVRVRKDIEDLLPPREVEPNRERVDLNQTQTKDPKSPLIGLLHIQAGKINKKMEKKIWSIIHQE